MSNDIQPEIRFPGFTEAWEQRKFECLLDKKDGVRRGPFGSALKKEFFVSNSNFVVYEQQNAIYDNYETRYKITEKKYNELIKFKLEPGDFIMSGAGTIGRISRVPKQIKPGVFNQALIRLRINKEITDSEYFIQFIRADFMQRKLTGANPGSAITNLVPMSEVKKWIVQFPILEEQKKIGNFFKQLDDTIALQQRKLDLLKETKKGFLQKMFPKNGAKVPEIRFPGFTEDWEQRKLGQVANYRRGSFPQPYGNKEWYDGENSMPFVQVVDVGDNLRLVEDTKQKISELAQPKSVFVEEGKVVVTLQGSIGRVAITQYPAYVDRTLLIFENYKAEMDEYYFAYVIQQLFEYEKTRAPGGTIKTITKEALSNFTISFPSIAEQKKLGKFFEQLDDTIALHQRKLDLLKETKKGFLQKMFV
ncbi:restriction endonuclease subunit S [Enterococcus faecium]|uniref:restriction endonuclease subunit S n=4 Tax=Enterococcus faecium TaxID=1352 RepID=UPI0029535FD0|nr:restriction endonuclease subunit S [Enterococcus faecium]MDV7692952.1 restriction endonuclease subunit S [Enterococcus faecium]